MNKPLNQFPVALEIGKKRVFASAADWPGWARNGRDEATALDALLAYGSRYQQAIRTARVDLHLPTDRSQLEVVERLNGNATTDFGAPGIALSVDSLPLDVPSFNRLQSILLACWEYFEEVAELAAGKSLRKGPRGGGRSLAQIVEHVIDSHHNYLGRIDYHEPHAKGLDKTDSLNAIIQADERALGFAVSKQMPSTGPRGGELWKPRYFVRRAAWHILDHAWEIEDKVEWPDG